MISCYLSNIDVKISKSSKMSIKVSFKFEHFRQEKQLPTDKYGFFVGKNESTDGMLTMMTGKSDINRIGEIQKFNGKERLTVWNGESCNKIR